MTTKLQPCPHALNSAKIGILFGMLRSAATQTNPKFDITPEFLDNLARQKHTRIVHDAIVVSVVHHPWRMVEWFLPCDCSTCYSAGQQGYAQGSLNRFPVEDIPRYRNLDAIRAIVHSRFNLNLTQLLPKIFNLYTPAH